MAIDVETLRSPGWWLKTLAKQLHERRFAPTWNSQRAVTIGQRPSLERLDSYLRGDPPLPKIRDGWDPALREVLRLAQMNYGLMSIQSVSHRLFPRAFATAADGDRDGDELASEVYDENRLGLRFSQAAEWTLGFGDAYWIVGPPGPGMKHSLITEQSPMHVITADDPATGLPIAGLHVFFDEWAERESAYVYLPGATFVAHRKARSASTATAFVFGAKSWEWDEDLGGELGQPMPESLGGRLPVVRMRNARGVGDFEPHLSNLDLINDGIFDRLGIGKHQAMRQRALKNLPDKDKDGNEIDYTAAFLAGPGSLWRLPEGVEVWESQMADLGPLRMAVKDDVAAFAALTGTPLHYISPDASEGSAEGASSMKENHLFRVRDRQQRFDAALRDVVSLAFAWQGDKVRAERSKIRTIWAPIEMHSLTERAQAASQLAQSLSKASIQTDILGYAPSDLPRLEDEMARELFFTATPAAAAPAAARG